MPIRFKSLPPQQLLLDCFYYDADTGLFYKIDDPYCVYEQPNGYLTVYFLGETYKVHRLIWKIVYGIDPSEQIDHINGIVDDNRLENLRSVTHVENGRNTKAYKKKSKLPPGIDIEQGRYRARIKTNGKKLHLGYFDDLGDAIEAREEAERKYRFHPNHGKR